jgi:N-acetylglucosamine kinase-like BadF-type ATPase
VGQRPVSRSVPGHAALPGLPAPLDHRNLPAVLAVDGGNSKTDMALVAADGTMLAQVRGPGVPIRLSGDTLLLLSELARSVAREAGLPHGSAGEAGAADAAGEGGAAGAARSGGVIARHMVACMANVDLPEEERELDEMLRAQGWSHTVDVANDTLALLRAGLGGRLPPGLPGGLPAPAPGRGAGPDRPSPEHAGPDHAGGDGAVHWGVAITCGAGINGVGVAPDSRITRFLALGTLTGDWGGGQGLALAVMWWAARAEDGRGPETLLRKAVTAHFGVSEVRDVAIGIHLGSIDEQELHGLVPILFEVSGRGDRVARDLVHRLADEVCIMSLTAMRRLALTQAAVPVVLGGSVLTARDPVLIEAIAAGLAAGAPASIMRIVDVPPVAGAALLGLDHIGAPASAQARLRSAYPGHTGGEPPRSAGQRAERR